LDRKLQQQDYKKGKKLTRLTLVIVLKRIKRFKVKGDFYEQLAQSSVQRSHRTCALLEHII